MQNGFGNLCPKEDIYIFVATPIIWLEKWSKPCWTFFLCICLNLRHFHRPKQINVPSRTCRLSQRNIGMKETFGFRENKDEVFKCCVDIFFILDLHGLTLQA